MTTLWVTHDPAEAAAVADRVAEMNAGKLLKVTANGPA
jgi:ABC-type sulfate/molybdate transport systems ATPase subunit